MTGAPPWFFHPVVPDAVTVTGSPHTEDRRDEPWEEVPVGGPAQHHGKGT